MNGFILTAHDSHNPLLQALREEGVDVRAIRWSDISPQVLVGCKAFYGNLFDEIKRWPMFISKRHLLRQAGVPYVFWNRDAPWNVGIKRTNHWFLKQLKPVDIYLAHSLQGAEDFGGQAFDFPNAAQPSYYETTDLAALNDESSYRYDVSFFGSAALGRDRNSRDRYHFLLGLNDRLRLACPEIRFKVINTAAAPMSIVDQLTFIRTTKINLNLGAMCDLPGNLSWGLPERVFGIPAAGGFLLTDQRRNLETLFPAETYGAFESQEGALELITRSLQDFSRLRYQAADLHQHVQHNHTYKHRAEHLIKILENYE